MVEKEFGRLASNICSMCKRENLIWLNVARQQVCSIIPSPLVHSPWALSDWGRGTVFVQSLQLHCAWLTDWMKLMGKDFHIWHLHIEQPICEMLYEDGWSVIRKNSEYQNHSFSPTISYYLINVRMLVYKTFWPNTQTTVYFTVSSASIFSHLINSELTNISNIEMYLWK